MSPADSGTAYYRGKQFAVLTESAVPESAGDIVDGGLGHQAKDVHHSVRNVAGAHRFFDDLRQPFFRADAWPQALRRSRPLRLHAVQRRERLLHRRVAAL